jgi:hypothetical protein
MDIAETRDAARRVIVIGGSALRHEQSDSQRKAQQTHQVQQLVPHIRISPEQKAASTGFRRSTIRTYPADIPNCTVAFQCGGAAPRPFLHVETGTAWNEMPYFI